MNGYPAAVNQCLVEGARIPMNSESVETYYQSAARRALASFPVDTGGIELIAHSENVTFRVSLRGGDTDYVLRLHRPGYNSLEELNSERLWTRKLAEAGISVPASLCTRRGEHFVLTDIPAAGEQRYAGMTTWMEGTPLNEYLESGAGSDERQRIFHRIGEIAATAHNQTVAWTEPPGFTRRRLDSDGLLGEAPHWGRFWEHAALTAAEKRLLRRTRDQLRAALRRYGRSPENFGLVHADLHAENIVHRHGELSLIDFDDSAYGWHMYDIASALFEEQHAADFDAMRDALLDGYRSIRPLAGRDIDMLRTFMLIRGMAIVGWFHERPEHAGSDFFEDVKRQVIGECESYA